MARMEFDILSKYRDGDEFWEYSSDNESWQLGMGQAGLVLLRNNRYARWNCHGNELTEA